MIADIQFTPSLTVEVSGSLSKPVIVAVNFDWLDSCQGTVDPETGPDYDSSRTAPELACNFVDDYLVPAVDQAIREAIEAHNNSKEN